ncbi:GNAT family N-acetyltransferase [Brenneria goodwinii]|uniref:GNAT family N-acetyltransferase n=1 Tax=Brenneria goodwinii TaxID=1109412 RepID=UPI0036F109BB
MIEIRQAGIDDLDKLSDIEMSADQAFKEISELAWIADDAVQHSDLYRKLILLGSCWILVNEKAPIGLLSAEVIENELHIWQLSVCREKQGKGHGRALLEKAIAMAHAYSLSAITLTTFSNVPWNAPFYARMGFNILDERNISERLKNTLLSEQKSGLPLKWRCAMVYELDNF